MECLILNQALQLSQFESGIHPKSTVGKKTESQLRLAAGRQQAAGAAVQMQMSMSNGNEAGSLR